MSLIAPVVFIIYKRLETTIRVFEKIKEAAPKRLYLIADGPKLETDKDQCLKLRTYVEENINWSCDLVKIYSEVNLGCAKRVQSGLDKVFENEEMAIILEDDTLPDKSFFSFTEELLIRYKDEHRVGHISGCNLFPEPLRTHPYSYWFTSIINIWGWATWKRCWKNYQIEMPAWEEEEKSDFLQKWCVTLQQAKALRKIFDDHCKNSDPWSWDFQWNYCCWSNNLLSILPSVNLVSNLGIGPNAHNTFNKNTIPMYPSLIDSVYSVNHPTQISRNTKLEKYYFKKMEPSLSRIIKNFFKKALRT